MRCLCWVYLCSESEKSACTEFIHQPVVPYTHIEKLKVVTSPGTRQSPVAPLSFRRTATRLNSSVSRVPLRVKLFLFFKSNIAQTKLHYFHPYLAIFVRKNVTLKPLRCLRTWTKPQWCSQVCDAQRFKSIIICTSCWEVPPRN